MSVVCTLAPVVVAATWPAFSAAVTAAATALGYTVLSQASASASENTQASSKRVEIQIEQSELVSAQLGRDQRICVQRDGVTVTFSRDARGRASLHVEGDSYDKTTLQRMGEELAHGVVQHYVYQRLKVGLGEHQYMVVEEETEADRTIRIKVRQWQS